MRLLHKVVRGGEGRLVLGRGGGVKRGRRRRRKEVPFHLPSRARSGPARPRAKIAEVVGGRSASRGCGAAARPLLVAGTHMPHQILLHLPRLGFARTVPAEGVRSGWRV